MYGFWITRKQIADYINKHGVVTRPQDGNIRKMKECNVLKYKLCKTFWTIYYKDSNGKLFKLPKGKSFYVEIDHCYSVAWVETRGRHGSFGWDYKTIAFEKQEIGVLGRIIAMIT